MNMLVSSSLFLAQTETTTGEGTVQAVAVDPLRMLVQGINRFDILNHPDQMIATLQDFHVVWGVIFLILGIIAIMNGHNWNRWIVMIIAFLVGVELGHTIGSNMAVSGVVAGCIGILCSVVAWPLMKHAVVICGALAGAFAGANFWTALGQPPDMNYAGAVIGFIMFGMFAFPAPNIISVAMTCVAGSFLMVLGGVSLMLKVEGWQQSLTDGFRSNTLVIPLVALVFAVLGFVVQQGSAFGGSPKKEVKASEGKPATA